MGEEPEGSQRRLVAILSMDAVGYSRLMAADEAGGRVVDNPWFRSPLNLMIGPKIYKDMMEATQRETV